MQSSTQDISAQIKNDLLNLGFSEVGFSKAEKLNEEDHLSKWLEAGYHGNMKYMEDHFEKRLDPRALLPGTKSLVSLLYNYYPEKELENKKYKIAKYAYGKDYHKVIKKKLQNFMNELDKEIPDLSYRIFVDSAPVMERQWAAKAGLGWTGKNTLLINKNKGSFFFLAEILLNVDLHYDEPIKDYCGSCTACLDACPTNAFPQPYILDASKCISYATIELKDPQLPELFKDKMEHWVFGCDICQDVCPWNRFSKSHRENAFKPNIGLESMHDEAWDNLDREKFDLIFEGSAVKRAKFEGFKRNLLFVQGD